MELSSKGQDLVKEEFYKVHWKELFTKVLDLEVWGTWEVNSGNDGVG